MFLAALMASPAAAVSANGEVNESREAGYIEVAPHFLWTAQVTQNTVVRHESGGAETMLGAGRAVIVNTNLTRWLNQNQYVRIVSGPLSGFYIRRAHLRDAPGVIPYQLNH